MGALGGLVRALELLADLSCHGKFRLGAFSALDHCMRLDSAAMVSEREGKASVAVADVVAWRLR